MPTVQIHDLIPSLRESEQGSSSNLHATGSIRHYELPHQTRTLLPGVNTEGLRVHRGRIYAEVQYTTTTTVMVAWDEGLGTYRAMHPQEMHPSGPALHFDPDSNTWRVGERQIASQSVESLIHRQEADDNAAQTYTPQSEQPSRAQPNSPTANIDIRHYVWDNAAANHHGYVVMHRKMRLDDAVGPPSQHAFMDDNGLFVSVEPPAHPMDQPAEWLPAWTDRDIWNLYGLQGADITRFRTEAHRTGKKPQWAKVRAQRMENVYLFDELRRWLGPDMDRDMFNRVLEHQKLTPAKWAEHLESVTLHRDTPVTQTPLPGLPAPDSPPTRLPSPDTPVTTETTPAYGGQRPHTQDLDSPHRSPTEPQAPPRLPTPETTDTTSTTYGHQRHYTWDLDKTDYHGYVEMQRKPGLDDSHGPLTQVAFREGSELTIVKPTRYSPTQRAFRPYWRDIDIWNLYRIEGADLLRFRVEVALNTKPPEWVKQREYPSPREQLIDYLRLWTNPDSPLKSREQVLARFRPYNLSTLQLAQLCREISPTGQFNKLINDELPAWATAHRDRTRLVSNSKLFDQLLPEIESEMIRLRNQGEGISILKASLTEPFFQQLLVHAGFKRNRHNFLYRIDIPAVFKVDDRTPFEIARPGAMLPQGGSTEGSTSDTPVSTLFSLKTAMSFANEITPPKHPADIQSHENNKGAPTSPSQRIRFCYLLDTRNVEVVPGQDNRAYNPTRTYHIPAGDKTRFPTMKMEGHVSMSSIGFTSRRVWLVNSSMTRAATVDDIHNQALKRATGSSQSHADAIEARTRSGALNRNEYDALIDEVANAGKRVIEFPAGKDIFSNDIVFAPETITL
ncbi:hypothetical protein [Pseudomonas gozinkensis]|uniref:hypothetical protein n=1 Tax=Pseudomonas gozinkensis TaxID=2774461 RepID=UPI0017887DAA|nr:hypothetical protein [Pseudomonas gozinkensis]